MHNRNFKYIDDWAFIRLVDSFVKINKTGVGNGEAALYLGNKRDNNIFSFFGCDNFNIQCMLIRNELIEYLNYVKIEYQINRYNYRNEVNIKTWSENFDEVMALPNELYFNLTRKRQFDKNGRVYEIGRASCRERVCQYV